MNSIVLRTAIRILITVLLLFSVFILLRGHDLPGGGFIGGLMAAGAISLYCVAYGPGPAAVLIRVNTRTLMGAGLLLALIAGLISILYGDPLLTSQWWIYYIGNAVLKLSTTLIFDIGVFLVVIGFVLSFVLPLDDVQSDEWQENPDGETPTDLMGFDPVDLDNEIDEV